ncbi:hypothetical protein DRV84_09985 [Rhodosalinus sediminis]|uniref:Sulfotransferase family protein n=1 Tax=Rhodosalinus sediminis TaxID=1940533 RepID=A0A3D9BS63_9RHOB|nr:sulfotransferase family 2 domain-containing protein [Rhodosalinus sediminis]REC56363.1 hypothetical protein DRV84_09985 [Rhodosalinus sediminis]
MKKDKLFWLHIKKSAGISTRKMLYPLYTEVDRVERPACFIQSMEEEYNDILNNYRVVLGQYQFRRCLFAQKFLYPQDFDRHLRVAFSRNPYDRCLSQFFYLWNKKRRLKQQLRLRLSMARQLKFRGVFRYDFTRFLDAIEECQESPANSSPYGLHFQTHTAAMWPDIVDDHGRCLLDVIFRLEDLLPGVNHVRTALGQQPLDEAEAVHSNKSQKSFFEIPRDQKRKIENLFSKDFEIYEGMCARFGGSSF